MQFMHQIAWEWFISFIYIRGDVHSKIWFLFRLAHQSENQDNLSQALESIQIVEATRPNRVGACWCSRATELIRLPHPATPDSIYAKYSASALWCWKNAHQPVGLGHSGPVNTLLYMHGLKTRNDSQLVNWLWWRPHCQIFTCWVPNPSKPKRSERTVPWRFRHV